MKPLSYRSVDTAQNGQPVPVFADGKTMYSRYDPERDARIFAEGIPESAGCVLVCGLGSALHVSALRRKLPRSKIIVIEASAADIDFLKAHADLSAVFADGDTVLCTPERIERTILETYIPVLHGDFLLAPLRAWADFHPNVLSAVKEYVRSALEKIAADTSTQARFGKIWHRNILQNLLTADTLNCGAIPPIAADKKALITGAGPTLDRTWHIMERNRQRFYVIAADTALAALARRHIAPDAVVTVDGSCVSAGHFYGKLPPETLVIADLCACPAAVRRAVRCGCPILFTGNGHPLGTLASGYFARNGSAPLPELETGAGTVTAAALDFAVKAGFRDVSVLGADFGYTEGKPYAKGTYLDDIYNRCSRRTLPQEQQFTELMYRSPVYRTSASILTTGTMHAYRTAFSAYVQAVRGVRIEWNGTEHYEEPADTDSATKAEHGYDMVPRPYRGREFAVWYTELLRRNDPAAITSVLPLAAWYRTKLDYKNDIFSLLKLAYTQTLRYTESHYGT